MRFMVIVKADKKSEAGVLPTAKELETMGAFNEQLIKAGVLVDAAGLQPTSKGAKVAFRNGKVHVTDGPFAETKELIAGYWIIDVKSKADAIEARAIRRSPARRPRARARDPAAVRRLRFPGRARIGRRAGEIFSKVRSVMSGGSDPGGSERRLHGGVASGASDAHSAAR